ncbi:hypothetical protein [Bowmanella pacifica]|uniref:hypothetical protein n=1 Tax=Bowmanella pacifica TaxID=502051 RepID=UPI0035715E3F
MRIEVHSQRTSGSVDMKFPFFLESLKLSPEPCACIFYWEAVVINEWPMTG